ncbi:MAG: DUF5685 family protein, partial [Clostridiales bacterium]
MFGYIVANREALTESETQRYRACYCGLCRSLKQRHGRLSRLTLSYDMTFTVLLLSSLYEPESCRGIERCVAHPMHEHGYWQNNFTDYAADMNIALSYHKCLDDWYDEHKLPEYFSAKMLFPHYQQVLHQYPRQCQTIEKNLQRLMELEKKNCANPDLMAGIFGDLMGELFVYREDHWAGILRNLGQKLGVFIYMMDACVDLDKDRKKGLYNPLLALGDDVAADYSDLLSILMGDCALEFEKLPLMQDIGVLR